MKKNQLFIFSLILVAEAVAVWLDLRKAEFILKPLICIWLIACFVYQAKDIRNRLKKWVIIALVFSWIGDILLMFQADQPEFFLAGLVSFLLAHISYILFFHFTRLRERIASRWYLMLFVVVYYTVLIMQLGPYLGDFAVPVRGYGIVISFMLMLAMHMLFMKNKRAGFAMLIGAALFVLSDSILAFNKFYQSFETAGVLIMLTYGMAQFFIVDGATRYLSSWYKE
jgi:uncharacterized membrane protein YhhN